jgi:hypothetical protein
MVVAAAFAMFAWACGGGEGKRDIADVTIETRPSATAGTSVTVTSKGGQPSHTATAEPTATEEPSPTATDEPAPGATNTPAPPPATSTPAPPPSAPTTGRWIDVDVTSYAVRLMDGESVVREIAPVGVGVAIDTGAYVSTQTGLFHVHTKAEALVYDAPFDTYISHWVGFDADKDNGFHSFLKDAQGNVVDASTGRVSNGCIRTGEPDVVFAYAEIGMPVWVHW